MEEVQDVNLIEKVCEKNDIISLCIYDPLEIVLVTNTKFLDKFNLDDAIQLANYMKDAHCMYTVGGYQGSFQRVVSTDEEISSLQSRSSIT